MTPQEHEKLQQFLAQMRQAQGVQRDPEADSMISAAVSNQPDAAYLLVQRTLLQEQAIEAARARIAELERQQQAPKPATSFLGGADDWGNSARTRAAGNVPAMAAPSSTPQAPAYQGSNQAMDPAQRQGGLSRFGMGGMGGGGSSFLGTMAATAAGVAGGAFLFQGIGNLLGGQSGANPASQGLASDTGGQAAPSGDNSLAQDAGLNNVSNSPPSQERGVMDDTTASNDVSSTDDFGGMDDFGGGDDTTV